MSETDVEVLPEPPPIEVVVEPPPVIEVVVEQDRPMQVVIVQDEGVPGPPGQDGADGIGAQEAMAVIEGHINSPNPHPVYDDGPSLLLLYQNAKV